MTQTLTRGTESKTKPLVFIVQSSHFYFKPTHDWKSELQNRDEVLYARSLVLAIASAIYSPVNIYLDSVTTEVAKSYNDSLEEDKKTAQGKPAGIPPRQGYLDNLLFAQLNEFTIGPANPALDDLEGENGAVSLATFDYSRIVDLLGRMQTHGADIRFKPAENDELYKRGLKVQSSGNKVAIRETNHLRDNNLYEKIRAESDGRTALVWYGENHEMMRFKEGIVEGLAYFDVATVHVGKNKAGVVEVRGVLPLPERANYTETTRSLKEFLQLGGFRVESYLIPRPRV